jgi:hypothetical protein
MNDARFIIDQPVIDEKGEEVILLSEWLLRKIYPNKRMVLIDLDDLESAHERDVGSDGGEYAASC